MRFEIIFHTPFRVASGHAADGSNAAVDRDALLPASSIKGLMRSAARDLLKVPREWDENVFGTAWRPSPWSWSDARWATAGDAVPQVRPRARIRVDAETGAVATGALLIADEVLAPSAEFSIDRTGWIDPADAPRHESVLLAAARAVTAVGGDRRRGLGWVTVIPADPRWTSEHRLAITGLIRAARQAETQQAATGQQRATGEGPASA